MHVFTMAVRRKIGGKYYTVREKHGSKGKRGTIMGKWKASNAPKKKKGFWSWLFS